MMTSNPIERKKYYNDLKLKVFFLSLKHGVNCTSFPSMFCVNQLGLPVSTVPVFFSFQRVLCCNLCALKMFRMQLFGRSTGINPEIYLSCYV